MLSMLVIWYGAYASPVVVHVPTRSASSNVCAFALTAETSSKRNKYFLIIIEFLFVVILVVDKSKMMMKTEKETWTNNFVYVY